MVVMPFLLRQRSRVVSYRPKSMWRRGGGKKTRAGSEGKNRENPRKPGKMKKQQR